MKLLIFGATGGTGHHVTEQALQQGYNVTAFVRNPDKLNIVHPNLRFIKGDVLNPTSVLDAMDQYDAVICCIGSPANKIGKIRSEGTLNIIKVMEQKGLSRFGR